MNVARTYEARDRASWDDLVRSGKNSTFLFCRDYMEYHADRFKDASVVVEGPKGLMGLLPANQLDADTVASHQGLTYGGLVARAEVTLSAFREIFMAVLGHLAAQGVSQLLYKRIPRFYNVLPDDEIDYLAAALNAPVTRVDTTTVVSLADRLPYDERRRRAIRRARRAGLRISETGFDAFWREVLEPRLAERYHTRPVHSLEEIRELARRFPNEIRQYSVLDGDSVVAGVTIYETPTVAHAQYIASTEVGRAAGALDFLFDWFIRERYASKRWFDFGTSNVDGLVNSSLLEWKEGFGARVVGHYFYRFQTTVQ